MPIEGQVLAATITPAQGFWFTIKSGIVLLGFMYFIFSIILFRQVNLMTHTLITETSSVLRWFAFFHVLLALGTVALLIILLLA